MKTPTSPAELSPTMRAWLRYAAKEHRCLQAQDYDGYVPQNMPVRTRDALIARGLYAKHIIVGMGGGFTYYRITDAGLALV